jgi:signal peptidase I
VNGNPLDEPYVHFLEPSHGSAEVTSFDVRERYGPVTVPAGHYFAMGDNRDNSQDSRYWGFLPGHFIKGRALMIYWSFESAEGGSAVSGLLGGTRWSRLFHQIH